MDLNIFIWVVLVIIGVSDAKTYRIPNKLLILLFALICISIPITTLPELIFSEVVNKVSAFVIAFVIGFASYLLRVMAPGDVKLVAVIGLFLGTRNLASYLFYVCLVTAFIGTMYWCLNRLYSLPISKVNLSGKGQAVQDRITSLVEATHISKQGLEQKLFSNQGLTYMPFAPILVIGLALQQYYV